MMSRALMCGVGGRAVARPVGANGPGSTNTVSVAMDTAGVTNASPRSRYESNGQVG
jgi:hypothetical protein